MVILLVKILVMKKKKVMKVMKSMIMGMMVMKFSMKNQVYWVMNEEEVEAAADNHLDNYQRNLILILKNNHQKVLHRFSKPFYYYLKH